jgi:type I restriction enzyme M protein
MLSKLSQSGTAGFVLANGSMSSNTSGEGEIRQQMVDNDMVDCMIALPGQLFYTTQIPVCIWFLTKNKKQDNERGYRDRQGETLFIDARNMGTMVDRTHKELTAEDITEIGKTYHTWRSDTDSEITKARHPELDSGSEVFTYEDIAGYCKAAKLEDIKANDYVLTPGRYVGVAEEEDDGIPFETKMGTLSQLLKAQMEQSNALDAEIQNNLKVLGYE